LSGEGSSKVLIVSFGKSLAVISSRRRDFGKKFMSIKREQRIGGRSMSLKDTPRRKNPEKIAWKKRKLNSGPVCNWGKKKTVSHERLKEETHTNIDEHRLRKAIGELMELVSVALKKKTREKGLSYIPKKRTQSTS